MKAEHIDQDVINIGVNISSQLELKLQGNQQININDVNSLIKEDISSKSLVYRRNIITLACKVLAYEQKSDSEKIDKVITGFLSKEEKLFGGVVLTDEEILSISDKIKYQGSQASKVLRFISKNQPLPKQARISLAAKLNVNDAREANQEVIESISASLVHLNELMTPQTQEFVNKFITPAQINQSHKDSPDFKAMSVLDGIELLMKHSKFTEGERLIPLRNHDNLAVRKRATELDEKHNATLPKTRITLKSQTGSLKTIIKTPAKLIKNNQQNNISEAETPKLDAGNLLIKQSSKTQQLLIETGCKEIKELKQEFFELNPNNKAISEFIKDVDIKLEGIKKAAAGDSKFFPQGSKITNYSPEQLCIWAKQMRQLDLERDNLEVCSEVMAGICRAVEIDSGYSPRAVQQMSVLLLAKATNNKGLLLQIKTGEGKSTITAMLAAYLNFFEKKPIDIVTSSSVLAQRDANDKKQFFDLLGLSANHNTTIQDKGYKSCYDSEIVYGDSLSFQADYLRSEFKLEGTRGSRPYSIVIVDEVDSMLIDEAAKIAKLATPICGMEHLGVMFITIARYLETLEVSREVLANSENFQQIVQQLTQVIEDMVCHREVITIPQFLKSFVIEQSRQWASCALTAIKMQENVDYVIAKNERGDLIIAPVDYSTTGVVQVNTTWSDGLHQFLQVKHLLRLTSESLTTSFISNMSYFKCYGNNIYGMSGTLGSKGSHDLLKNIYNIDTAIIPTFKPKIFNHLPGQVTEGEKSHLEAISLSALKEVSDKRAVLIIAETILEGTKIPKELEAMKYQGNIRQYFRSDEKIPFDSKVQSGDIIIATNLAGRGTDIITNRQVEEAGGLHVIITFLPSNFRVEEQALGRTSRQGNKGSGELIIDGAKTAQVHQYDRYMAGKTSLQDFKIHRDLLESIRLARVAEVKVAALGFEDQLFDRFNKEIYQPMLVYENNPQKLMQLEDLWGFWLAKVKRDKGKIETKEGREEITQQFEVFKQEMISKYQDGMSLMVNPAYVTIMILNSMKGVDNIKKATDLFGAFDSIDPEYSYQLNYLRAYVQLNYNQVMNKDSEGGKRLRQESVFVAAQSLNKAYEQLNGAPMNQLQAAIFSLGSEASGSPLYQQLHNKLRLHETVARNIAENLNYITQNSEGESNTIQVASGSVQTMHSLFSSKVHESDILEMANFGLPFLYSSAAKSYRKDYISGSLTALVGIGQVVVGALITIGSGGFAAQFGIGIAASGISDVIGGMQAAFEGRSINFQEWAKNKAIDMAVNLALSFVGAKISAVKEAKAAKSAGSGLVQGSKAIANGWEFGVRLGMRVAETKLIELGTEQFVKAMARPIKGYVKELLEEIRAKFHEQNVRNNLQRICWYDSIRYQRDGFYEQKFIKQVLQSLDQKESEFGKIAQKLLSSTISQGVSSSSARIGVMVASTAYEVSKGVSEVQELVEFVKERVVEAARRGEKEIPAFGWVIANQVGGDVTQGNEIAKMLQEQGLIDGQLRVDSQKFSINQSIMSLRASEGNTPSLRGAAGDVPIQGGTTEPSLRAIGDGAAIPGGTTNTPTPFIFEELEPQKSFLGKYDHKRIDIFELLERIDQGNKKNYDRQIEVIAESITGAVEQRLNGQVRASVATPLVAPIVSSSVSHVLEKSGLEQMLLNMGSLTPQYSGVSAGDAREPGLLEKLLGKKKAREDENTRLILNAVPYDPLVDKGKEEMFIENEHYKEERPIFKAEGDIAFKDVSFNHPSSLSDEAIKKQYKENIFKPDFMLDSHQKGVREEHDKRFREQVGENHKRAVGQVLDLARGGDLIKYGIYKFTGEKIGSFDGVSDITGARLVAARGGNKGSNVKEKSEWQLPSGEAYKKGDVNWDQIRTVGSKEYIGKTNTVAGRDGHLPQLPNGEFVVKSGVDNSKAKIDAGAIASTNKLESVGKLNSEHAFKALDIAESKKVGYKDISDKLEYKGSYNDPKNYVQHKEYKVELRRQMEKPHVEDKSLKLILSDLYRPNASVGSGSTAKFDIKIPNFGYDTKITYGFKYTEKLTELDFVKLQDIMIKIGEYTGQKFDTKTLKELVNKSAKYYNPENGLIGNFQKTGTPGHDIASRVLAEVEIGKFKDAIIFTDQGLRKIFPDMPQNLRPDLMIVKPQEIKLIEVRSNGQMPKKNGEDGLLIKLENIQETIQNNNLSTAEIVTEVWDIDEVWKKFPKLMKKYSKK